MNGTSVRIQVKSMKMKIIFFRKRLNGAAVEGGEENYYHCCLFCLSKYQGMTDINIQLRSVVRSFGRNVAGENPGMECTGSSELL